MTEEHRQRKIPAGYTPAKKSVNKKKHIENTSGAGETAVVPALISKRFNWGAFFLNWIWGLGNKTYITLLVFLVGWIPLVNLGCLIWFGIKGNEWAWRNKRWKGPKHFHHVQKNWAIAGVIIWILSMVISVFMFMSMIAIGMQLPANY